MFAAPLQAMSTPMNRSTASTSARVHGLCLRMARDQGEAEELVQDVFVRVWERMGSFRGDSAFGTWVHRVGVNVVIESMRAKGRWRDRVDAGADPDDIRDSMFENSAGADIDLERAIAKLPERARLVFLLHDVDGHKHREIAEMTGLAVGTSKAHLHRARTLLRDALANEVANEVGADAQAAKKPNGGHPPMSFLDRWRRFPDDTSGDSEPRDPEIAALLERARTIPRDAEPSRDLWQGIANRIAEAERAPEPASRWSVLGELFPRPILAMGMAASLVVVTVLATSYALQGPALPTTPAGFAALADEVRSRDGVAGVHADLLSIIESRRDSLPAETFAALEENVRQIDRALVEIHIALLDNPQDHALVFLLAETHRREAELLERMEWWMRGPGESKS